eukprot:472423-Rhodomonas_salina.1
MVFRRLDTTALISQLSSASQKTCHPSFVNAMSDLSVHRRSVDGLSGERVKEGGARAAGQEDGGLEGEGDGGGGGRGGGERGCEVVAGVVEPRSRSVV